MARVRFEDVDDGGEEGSASESELSGRADVSNDEEEESGDETRKMVAQQNRKGKKSGGFQSMGTSYAKFTNNAIFVDPYLIGLSLIRSESCCVHWCDAQGVQSSYSDSKKGACHNSFAIRP